jgi:hypothetical protein
LPASLRPGCLRPGSYWGLPSEQEDTFLCRALALKVTLIV